MILLDCACGGYTLSIGAYSIVAVRVCDRGMVHFWYYNKRILSIDLEYANDDRVEQGGSSAIQIGEYMARLFENGISKLFVYDFFVEIDIYRRTRALGGTSKDFIVRIR